MTTPVTTRSRRPLTHPWRDMGLGLRDIESLLSSFWGPGEVSWLEQANGPSFDLSENPEGFEVTMDVPGVKPDDIDIQLHGNLLTVSGHREEETEEQNKKFHRVERRTGTFSRSVTLPSEVEEATVEARCNGGVLKISLPKRKEQRAKKIQVK